MRQLACAWQKILTGMGGGGRLCAEVPDQVLWSDEEIFHVMFPSPWNKEVLVQHCTAWPSVPLCPPGSSSHDLLSFFFQKQTFPDQIDGEGLKKEQTAIKMAEQKRPRSKLGRGGVWRRDRKKEWAWGWESEWTLCDQKVCLFSWRLNSSGATLMHVCTVWCAPLKWVWRPLRPSLRGFPLSTSHARFFFVILTDYYRVQYYMTVIKDCFL